MPGAMSSEIEGRDVADPTISIREPKYSDFVKLQRMLDNFDERDKRLFHPLYIGFNKLSFFWLGYQLILLLNSWHVMSTSLMRIFPRLARFDLVAVNKKNDVVGFAYLEVKERFDRVKYSAEFGIALSPSLRGRRLASAMMKQLFQMGFKRGVRRIRLIVMSDNERAMKLYARFGFKAVRIVLDKWQNKNYESVEMVLDPLEF